MVTEGLQTRFENLLAEQEEAVPELNWTVVRNRAQVVVAPRTYTPTILLD